MSVLPLCYDPHSILRQQARPVTAWTEDVRGLARDMIDTMYASDGIGLAAPQVGQALQFFVANPSQQRGKELVLINPVLEDARGRASVMEGCLSLPNVWQRVARAALVRMSGQDFTGQQVCVEAEGVMAIVLQHEWDHLQGHLFVDRLPWIRRCRLGVRTRRAPPLRVTRTPAARRGSS